MESTKPQKLRLVFLVFLLALVSSFYFFSSEIPFLHDFSHRYVDDSDRSYDDFDSITLNTGDKFNGSIIAHTETSLSLKPIAIGHVNHIYEFEYRNIRDITLTKNNKDSIFRPQPLSVDVEKERFQKLVQTYYDESNFKKLEKLHHQIYENKERFSSSEWKLPLFYIALQKYHKQHTLIEIERHIEKLSQWRNSFPKSTSPTTLLIRAYTDLAWKHRGSGFNNKVSIKGREKFEEALEVANKLIDSVDKQTVLNPEFHSSRISVSVGLSQLRAELEDILKSVDKYDEDYYTPYTKAAPFLLPRWIGRKGGVENYANWVALKNNDNKTYARIAAKVKDYTDESNYKKMEFDWEKIKDGFNTITKSYDISLHDQHSYIWMACYYQDYPTVKVLTDRAGLVWNKAIKGIWGGFSNYHRCKTLSNLDTQPIDLFREIRDGNLLKFTNILKNKKDITIDEKNQDGESPLFYAIRTRYFDFAEALINNGASPVLSNNNTTQPIHKAAERGAINVIYRLLEKGVDVNTQDKKWLWTPLHYATNNVHRPVMKLLLSTDEINVNIQNNAGQTPLHFAVEKGRLDIVENLLKVKTVDINIADQFQNTPLNIAIDNKYTDIAELLKINGGQHSDKGISSKQIDLFNTIFNEAKKLHDSGDLNASEKLYLKALTINPYSPATYSNLALIDMFRHDFDACLENTAKAIDIDNTHEHSIYSAGQCAFMLHKPKQEYLNFYRRYIEIKPNNFRTKELFLNYPELKVNR